MSTGWRCFPTATVMLKRLLEPPCCVFLHWSESLADVVIYFVYISGLRRCSALCDVSTVSFPLQSSRIRSCSRKDRSLEWTQSLPAEMADHFASALPPVKQLLTLMSWLSSCKGVKKRVKEKKNDCVCTFVEQEQEQNGTKARFELCCPAFYGLEFIPWHICMTFNLTFNH